MQKFGVLSLILCTLLLTLVACGSPAPQAAPSGAASSPATAKSGASAVAAAGGAVLDVTFTGGLQGHWGTGDRSTGMTCTTFGNDNVQMSLFGVLNGVNYGFGVHQDGFTAATYTFPIAGDLAKAPWAQITTSSNSRAQWDLQGPSGKGTLTLAGNARSEVSGVIDADLADQQGGAAVHAKGSFKCKIGGG